MGKHDLVIATRNLGKVKEYAELLADYDFNLLSLDDVGVDIDVEETGTTFAENATLKATQYAEASSKLTLADDSGLEVDALDGEPGVYSARYGGEGLTDAQRYRKLLAEMRDVPLLDRTARFRCVIAIAQPGKPAKTADGTLEGHIAFQSKGSFGFGYDPVFHVDGYRMTLAQIDPTRKNRISHRARALEAILPTLLALVDA